MKKILIVSNDLTVLSTTKSMLLGRFDVLSTDDEFAGLALLREYGQVGAVICDTHLRNMSGPAFLRKAAQVVPDSVLAFLTNPKDRSAKPVFQGGPPIRALRKPIEPRQFLAFLDDIDRAEFFPQPLDGDASDHAIRSELSVADPDREFSMLYQPRICAKTGRTCSVEALLRWDSSTLGPVSPSSFIPVAEQTGDIVWITDWTLRQACGAVRTWIEKGGSSIPVSVNVSSKACADTRLIALTANALRVSGIPTRLLRFEISGGMEMLENAKAVSTLSGLAQLGIKVDIDGYTFETPDSASCIGAHRDVIRTGQAVIGRVSGRGRGSMLQSIHDLGIRLGVKTVAARVENLQDAEFIRKLGFDQMQGFHISAPLSQIDLPIWVKTHSPC